MKKEKEDILKFLVQEKNVYLSDIEGKFNIPNIREVIDDLVREGKIKIQNDGRVVLTPLGLLEGKNILEKHEILERLLKDIGVNEKEAHKEAHELEHFLPDEGKERIKGVFGFNQGDIVTLLSLSSGDEGEIVSIRGGRGMVQRLLDMGLTPGTRIKVIRRAPFGPIEISVRGYHLALGRGIAGRIWVRRRR
ncbi:MAG: FeoA domain-containing protein [Caldisericia bacterium]|nr:FeoA domain-containing protein [Caldisericia bacterium]